MKALVQRVSHASVEVTGEVVGSIGPGVLALIGVTHDDDSAKARLLARKIWGLRIFDDNEGKMNLSASDLGLELLVVSQFTLYGNAIKGRRPTFVDAARPELAEPLVNEVVSELRRRGAAVATGRFRTEMKVSLLNDGPVTLTIEV